MSDPAKGLKKRKDLKIEVENKQEDGYLVTKSGTFREGDVEISKRGLLVKGESPQATPKARNTTSDLHPPPIRDRPPTSKPSHSSNPKPLKIEDGPFSMELKDLQFLEPLGNGSSGIVKKALHVKSGGLLAVKVIQLDINENVRKQILLELKTLHKTQCEYVVSFFDAFYDEGSFFIALEFMDGGSLADVISYNYHKKVNIPEPILGKIALQVLLGLNYLHKKLHLIHRDIKPTNLLINREGAVKISDFGVSGQLAHTLSKCVSWVGTVTYMSPERISGNSYSFDSDIWSVGLTLVECALGRFPYPSNSGGKTSKDKEDIAKQMANLGFWELVDFIVKEPPPKLPSEKFSVEFCDLIDLCLQKTPEDRPSASTLLEHPWIKKAAIDSTNLPAWLQNCINE